MVRCHYGSLYNGLAIGFSMMEPQMNEGAKANTAQRPNRFRRILIAGIGGFLSSVISCSAFATSASTDPALPVCAELTPQDGELGYKARHGYCEGLYVQQVHSVLRLVSLIEAGTPKAVAPAGFLAVAVPPTAPAMARKIRVVARNPAVPYRLDATLQTEHFEWPASEVVKPVLGQKPELDVLVRSSDEHPIFVPVQLNSEFASTTAQANSMTRTSVFVVSTIPAESYLARIVGDAGTKPFELRARLNPPSTRIQLDIPNAAPRGKVELWFRARLLGAATPEEQRWLIWLP